MNAVVLADGLARGRPQRRARSGSQNSGARSAATAACRAAAAAVRRRSSFTPIEARPQVWFDALARSRPTIQSAQHQPAPRGPRTHGRFRRGARVYQPPALHLRDQCAHRTVRSFRRDKITADAVLASACLPLLFHAVEIDGEPYWDGGYHRQSGALSVLRARSRPNILLIQINPIERHEDADGRRTTIMNRVNEITFNSSLLRELRAIDFVTACSTRAGCRAAPSRTNSAASTYTASCLTASARISTPAARISNDYDFFEMLRVAGKRAAKHFLDFAFRRHRRAQLGRPACGGESRMDVRCSCSPAKRSG